MTTDTLSYNAAASAATEAACRSLLLSTDSAEAGFAANTATRDRLGSTAPTSPSHSAGTEARNIRRRERRIGEARLPWIRDGRGSCTVEPPSGHGHPLSREVCRNGRWRLS